MQYDRAEACPTVRKFLLYKFFLYFTLCKKIQYLFFIFRFLPRPLPSPEPINGFPSFGSTRRRKRTRQLKLERKVTSESRIEEKGTQRTTSSTYV